jgi:hypothetical protein
MRSAGPRLEVAWRGEGSIVAPGAWEWPVGGVPAARLRLGLLSGVSGAVVAAAGVRAAVAWWRCGLRLGVGWGAVG